MIEHIGRELAAVDKAIPMIGCLFRDHAEGASKRKEEPLLEKARTLVQEMIDAVAAQAG